MAKKFPKVLVWILVFATVLSITCTTALADSQTNAYNFESDINLYGERTADPSINPGTPSIGIKTDERIDDKNNRYKVTIEVPGIEDTRHDEVILMVDGSYSLDDEWPAMKNAINTIGETVLNGSGTTQLTLMAFGMGDNIVLKHVKDADELAAALGNLPGSLLYGRSSTNCEAGFSGVEKYIANHDDSLKDAYVIFISDGNINTDETPRMFDTNWKTFATKLGSLTVAQTAFEEAVFYGENLPSAYYTVFGDRYDGLTKEEICAHAFGVAAAAAEAEIDETEIDETEIDEIEIDETEIDETEIDETEIDETEIDETEIDETEINAVEIDEADDTQAQAADIRAKATDEEFYAFADQIWADVYEYSNLTPGKEYPVSVVERAFVKYDKEKGTYIQDAFYLTTYKSSYVTYNDRWTRTPIAANSLAAMDEVAGMYVVDYDSYTSWMDTGITNEKSTFIKSNGIAGLCTALAGVLDDLSKMPFNDVVITDYMSKWVNFDPTTLEIINNSTGQTIWTVKEGWLIDEALRPTAKENPVVVELVGANEYTEGGIDVMGNTSGNIYKLTWYMKDGSLLRSDTYTLKYEVTVDTEEAGYKPSVNYPANGFTNIHYNDENGNRKSDPIVVPDVYASTPKQEDNTPGGNTPGGNTPGGNRPGGNTPGGNRPNGNVTIEDDRVPTANRPVLTVRNPNSNLITIEDEAVPLSNVPETGDNTWIIVTVMAAAITGITLIAVCKNRKKNSSHTR